ncbi:hypothetical protein GM658_06135 [Pseudoduganella eburnea]|uniref:Uncharacterized protein n=1 Tax=Massilia eburnea TaxID=1776165 RepID=A0A6L6QE91_9BURK|nr:hypothetical protein [Massilia eburnea]MTW10177.1 hypothetical protein [Massilia eburnea]
MKRISRWLLGMITVTPFFSQAQVTCPKELKWIDATYAERKITRDGQIESAKIEAFLNASVIHVDIGNVQSGMIEIFPKNHADSIRLTFGRDRPKPSDFAEVSMLVEPPMTNAAWPRMMGPCAVSSGTDIEFDESDVPDFIEAHANNIPKFKGIIRRDGLNVSYSMKVESGERWQGELNYSRDLQSFDLQTDVQGWHVFRANTYIKTLPSGAPVSLLSVIEHMPSTEQKE